MRYGLEYEDIHENMHIHRRERKYKSHKIAIGAGRSRFTKTTSTLSSAGDVAAKKSKS